MGGSASTTQTNISNNYNLTNSSLTNSGTQSIGSASSHATTDVSPQTDMNYSEGVNPSWWGYLLSSSRNSKTKIVGTVGNNFDLIQTVKHVSATAIRVAMGDESFTDKTFQFANSFLKSSTPEGSLTSSEQVPFDTITEAANLQSEIIERLPEAHDAYASLALGQSGMRNKEVSTMPTKQSLAACYRRATPMEQANAEVIVNTVGPRMGIVPKNATTPPSSIIIDAFNNSVTKYGRVEKVKQDGRKMAEEQNNMLFSVLHARGGSLAESNVLRPVYWESNQIIGALKQHSTPSTAACYPNGNVFTAKDTVNSEGTVITDVSNGKVYKEFGLSAYAYSLTEDDDSRVIRMLLSGQLVIVNQEFDPTHEVRLGFIYKNRDDDKFYFQPVAFINTEIALTTGGEHPIPLKQVYSVHDDDPQKLTIADDTGIYTHDSIRNAKRNGKVLDLKAARAELSDAPALFSYITQYQGSVNLTDCKKFDPTDAFATTFRNSAEVQTILALIYPPNMTVSISVQVPSINCTDVRIPRGMKYIGKQYDGSVLDLLGEAPQWYATIDPHDPVAIYYQVMKPLINVAGKIAVIHVNSGAPYRLTCDHVINCRVKSGLPALDEDHLKLHIMVLISDIARWLSTGGPVAPYTKQCRKQLFMHLAEKVMVQYMTHIEVYTSDYSKIISNYLKDCEEQNIIERKMDDAMIASY